MHTKTTSLSRSLLLLIAAGLFLASPSQGEVSSSSSGRLDLRGVDPRNSGTAPDDPGLFGRIKFDGNASSWKFHSWLEGGWDGTVKRPARDHSLFKNYDTVYQSNTPYFEFKELFVAYSGSALDLKAGIQRFSWGRLDEYPANDLLNPWDYTQYLRKPLEDRKIGVPSLSANLTRDRWTVETVLVPSLVPYRLPMPDERWAGSSFATSVHQALPNAQIVPQEPDLPARTLANSNGGLRITYAGDIEWGMNLYHGFDPRPVFRTTALLITPTVIDPGYVPDFHRITVVGIDAAAIVNDWSLRMEIAYASNRYLNIRKELWGYPAAPGPGLTALNPSIEEKHDTLDYGIGADYRLFEDGTLLMQVQQTMTLGNTGLLYEKKRETIVWANLKVFWMNQKVETNASIAYNPEHRDAMAKLNAWYVLSDSWKAGVTGVAFNGPEQSIFGRYSRNDQMEAELIYSW